MTVCRPPIVRALAVVAVALVFGGFVRAEESPVGKIIARVVPVNNKVHNAELILSQLWHTKAGKTYEESAVDEDLRRLMNTKWFAPGGVQIKTAIDDAGQVTVYVYVVELNNIVNEVVFIVAQHLREKELMDLSGVRKGSPLNPATNQLGAQAIQNKLKEDGRPWATVNLREGDKPTDSRVVYDIVEGPVVRVGKVSFRGNEVASTGRLKTVLTTTGALIPGTPTILTPKFNAMMVETDKQKLLEYYHRLGHLDARITEEVATVPGDMSQVDIVYHISEGRPFTVRNIRIDGNKLYTEDRLMKVVSLKPNQRYDKDVVQADVENIKRLHGNSGVNAVVHEELYAAPDEPGKVDVRYEVYEPGREPDRVGRIIIRGNSVTHDRVILNQLGLYPGQILQYPRLEEAKANLIRTGLFDQEEPPSVTVLPQDNDSNFKDIEVRVKETRTGSVMLSANVNSNAGVNGALTVNQRNFDIARFPTSFDDLWAGRAFRGGGQELQLQAMPGSQFSRYSITHREPYLFDSRFGLTSSAYYFNRFYNEYAEDRVGLRETVDYRFDDSPIWRANYSLRVENVEVKDTPLWAPPSITQYLGHSFLVGQQIGVTRDTRDSYLLPTKGSTFNVAFEQVLGEYVFPIGTAEGNVYQTLYQRKDGSGKQILAVRSQLAIEGGNAPVFERFYAGGFRSLRGFTFRGVGPYENFLNVGGTFSFLNTVEYQVPVLASDKLYLVGFVDHGTVEQGVKITDYRVSVGTGLRISVAALGPMPIALDFAFPIVKGPQDQEQVFSFYVGWFGGQ
jgi:outer membrane protein insertion porin family